MVNAIKQFNFLRHSINFPRYIFSGLDCVDFKLNPDQKLEIFIDKNVFLLSRENDIEDSLAIDCLTGEGEQTLTTLSKKNTTFIHKNKDGLEFWVLVDGKVVQIGGGTGLMIMGPNVVEDVKRFKTSNKDPRDPMRGHIIGNLYDPQTGHIIDGGSHCKDSTHGIKPPFITIDFERDVELQKAYKNIISDLGLNDPNKKETISEESILERVFNEFKDLKYLYDKNPLKEKLKSIHRGIRVGPLVKRLGGICCYQAYIVCAILEKLILDKYLSGRVFYGGDKKHGWPLYISQDENVYVLDSTQQNFTDLTKDPDKTFCGIEEIDGKEVDGRFKYIDFLPADLKICASLIHIHKTNQE